MKVIIVRHAIAQDREEFSLRDLDDSNRPLTEKGIDKMRCNARGISELVGDIPLIATSGYKRADQTAEILKSLNKGASLVKLDSLMPGCSYSELYGWLESKNQQYSKVCLVGHEPHLSGFVADALSGTAKNIFLHLKKGSLCIIEFSGKVASGGASITCLLQPSGLRKIQ